MTPGHLPTAEASRQLVIAQRAAELAATTQAVESYLSRQLEHSS
jgi:hypothetical protein